MKKTVITALLLAILTLLVSCEITLPFGDSSDTTPTPKKDGYIIIAPEAQIKEHHIDYSIFAVKKGLRDGGFNDPKSISDAKSYSGNLYEVLIGQTNRPLSSEAYALIPEDASDAYVFSVLIKNGDIAICANSDTAYKIAAKWFSANIVNKDIPTEYSAVMFTTEDVYAAEGNEATCFEIAKLYSGLFIGEVALNGVPLESFRDDVYSYTINISVRDSIPDLTVSCPAFVKCDLKPASESDPAATVTVTSSDGSSSATYTFDFIKDEVTVMTNASVEKVYGGRDAIVVIVHDDGTKETVNYLSASFSSNDLVGTIGLIANKIATQDSDGDWSLNMTEVAYWRNILRTGRFDIANHSLTHKFWGISNEAESGYYLDSSGNMHEYSYEAGRITDEVVLSKELLQQAFPNEDILAFIKPGFGRVTDENGTTGMTQISDVAYRIIAEHYVGMRDTGGGVNEIPVTNILKVSSHTVRGTDTASTWQNQVNQAIQKNGMIVFLFHTIIDNPSDTSLSGKTSETDKFFSWLGDQKAEGTVWNTYLDDAMRYVTEYEHAELDVKDHGDRIVVSVTDDLDDDIYNHPLTVKIPVPENVDKLTVKNGAVEEDLEIHVKGGIRFVLVDVIPDGDSVVIYTK